MPALSLVLHRRYLEQNSAKALSFQCCSYHSITSSFLVDVFVFNTLHNEPPLIYRRNETPATEPTFRCSFHVYLTNENIILGVDLFGICKFMQGCGGRFWCIALVLLHGSPTVFFLGGGPKRQVVINVLCQTYFLFKFVHGSVCSVNSDLRVFGAPNI
jgi:hypothetical protein